MPQIIADKIEPLEIKKEEKVEEDREYMGLIIPERFQNRVDTILDICQSYPGNISVIVAINGKKYDAHLSVRRCEGLLSELRSFLEKDEIIFFKKK